MKNHELYLQLSEVLMSSEKSMVIKLASTIQLYNIVKFYSNDKIIALPLCSRWFHRKVQNVSSVPFERI